MSETSKLIEEIRTGLSQKSASQKDEVRVMKSMLNDQEYVVGVYGSAGKIGEYSPFEDSRKMLASVINEATGVSKDEAATLANNHQFSNGESTSMVNLSKEFVNTYAQTTRKLPLGGRETSNVSLQGVHVDASTTRYPKKVGIDADGKGVYESTVKSVPTHDKIKAAAPCPTWVK